VWANFWGVLGLVVLNNLLSILGVMACYVGAFFIMPVHFATIVVAYRQVFPADGSVLPLGPTEPPPHWPSPGDSFRGPSDTGIQSERVDNLKTATPAGIKPSEGPTGQP
jgi:hypothetical protein